MFQKATIILFLLLLSKLNFAQSQYKVGKKMENVILELGKNYTKYQDANGYDVLFYTLDVPNDALGFGTFSQSLYLHFDKNICIGLDMSYPIEAADHFELSYNDQFPRIKDNEWRSRDGIYFIIDRNGDLVIISIQKTEYYDKLHKK